MKLLALGSAAGLILGLLTSKLLASIVYSTTPGDPLVLAGVVLVMLLLGLLATLIPARRALLADPLNCCARSDPFTYILRQVGGLVCRSLTWPRVLGRYPA